MSQTKSEFVTLGDELFDEFEIGQDAREKITLTNPGESHPVTGPTPGESLAGRFLPSTYSVKEVNNGIATGDVKGIFLTKEWNFPIDENTTGIDDVGNKFEVISVSTPPKDVIKIVQLRPR